MKKLASFRKKYIPTPALVLYAVLLLSVVLYVLFELSTPFADFFNRTIGAGVRMFLAFLTSLLPFSLAEMLIFFLPLVIVLISVFVFRCARRDQHVKVMRFFACAFAILGLFFTSFVFTIAPGYRTTPIAEQLGLVPQEELTAAQLRDTAAFLVEQVNNLAPLMTATAPNGSTMPYTFAQMNRHLNSAVVAAGQEYAFIHGFPSRVKPIMASGALSRMLVLGMYSYFTGEANVNTQVPDHSMVFTAAHEMAHQRGISREDEANFVAFLICIHSDSDFIRYSGYLGLLDYFLVALWRTNTEYFHQVRDSLHTNARTDISAVNAFFAPFRDGTIANVSRDVNNAFLNSQGQDGNNSYGMVVDIAILYLAERVRAGVE
ncbi:MAG: DUF3810 domain-containing protein [Oscillospiraceae bacterium]|nr:DUF3810 domain-containing protein [Oscillospiraceae bacterium]